MALPHIGDERSHYRDGKKSVSYRLREIAPRPEAGSRNLGLHFRCPLIPATDGRGCLDDRIRGVVAEAVAPLAHHHHRRVEGAGAAHGVPDLLLEDGPHAAAGAVPGGLGHVIQQLEDGDDGGGEPGEQ